MFRNWGFLLAEMWVLLGLAAVLGLVVGWIVWGRRFAVTDAVRAELETLRHDLARSEYLRGEAEGRLARAEADRPAP